MFIRHFQDSFPHFQLSSCAVWEEAGCCAGLFWYSIWMSCTQQAHREFHIIADVQHWNENASKAYCFVFWMLVVSKLFSWNVSVDVTSWSLLIMWYLSVAILVAGRVCYAHSLRSLYYPSLSQCLLSGNIMTFVHLSSLTDYANRSQYSDKNNMSPHCL